MKIGVLLMEIETVGNVQDMLVRPKLLPGRKPYLIENLLNDITKKDLISMLLFLKENRKQLSDRRGRFPTIYEDVLIVSTLKINQHQLCRLCLRTIRLGLARITNRSCRSIKNRIQRLAALKFSDLNNAMIKDYDLLLTLKRHELSRWLLRWRKAHPTTSDEIEIRKSSANPYLVVSFINEQRVIAKLLDLKNKGPKGVDISLSQSELHLIDQLFQKITAKTQQLIQLPEDQSNLLDNETSSKSDNHSEDEGSSCEEEQLEDDWSLTQDYQLEEADRLRLQERFAGSEQRKREGNEEVMMGKVEESQLSTLVDSASIKKNKLEQVRYRAKRLLLLFEESDIFGAISSLDKQYSLQEDLSKEISQVQLREALKSLRVWVLEQHHLTSTETQINSIQLLMAKLIEIYQSEKKKHQLHHLNYSIGYQINWGEQSFKDSLHPSGLKKHQSPYPPNLRHAADIKEVGSLELLQRRLHLPNKFYTSMTQLYCNLATIEE